MKRDIVIFVAILSITVSSSVSVNAQDTLWLRTYGWNSINQAYSMCETSDNGYAIVGLSTDTHGADYILRLLKIDADGDTVWSNSIEGDNEAISGRSITLSQDDGFMVVGRYEPQQNQTDNLLVTKFSENGDLVWLETYDFVRTGQEVIRTIDGNYAIIGSASESNGYAPYLFIIDDNGDSLWLKIYVAFEDFTPYAITQTDDSGYLMTGGISTDDFGIDCFLIRANSDGGVLWTRQFGGIYGDWIWAVVQADDGGFYLGGARDSHGLRTGEGWLIKTNHLGHIEWTQEYGGWGSDYICDLAWTNDGNMILLLWSESIGPMGFNVRLVKVNPNGDVIWDRAYGGDEDDFGYKVLTIAENQYVVAGFTESFGDNSRFLAIKVFDEQTDIDATPGVRYQLRGLHIYPNPFNTSTVLNYDLREPCLVTIAVFSIVGQRITTLYKGFQTSGSHSLAWNAVGIPSGIYFISLKAKEQTGTQRVTLLK